MGLPVVASRVAGNEELITHGETGFLADPSEPEEFASHILCLLDSPALVRAITAKASAFADHLFSVDKQISEHLLIYESVTSKHGAAGSPSNNRSKLGD
jgi:L-malate glycosyltransferase